MWRVWQLEESKISTYTDKIRLRNVPCDQIVSEIMGGRQSISALRHVKNDAIEDALIGSTVHHKNGSVVNSSSRHDKKDFPTSSSTCASNDGYAPLECKIYSSADMLTPV